MATPLHFSYTDQHGDVPGRVSEASETSEDDEDESYVQEDDGSGEESEVGEEGEDEDEDEDEDESYVQEDDGSGEEGEDYRTLVTHHFAAVNDPNRAQGQEEREAQNALLLKENLRLKEKIEYLEARKEPGGQTPRPSSTHGHDTSTWNANKVHAMEVTRVGEEAREVANMTPFRNGLSPSHQNQAAAIASANANRPSSSARATPPLQTGKEWQKKRVDSQIEEVFQSFSRGVGSERMATIQNQLEHAKPSIRTYLSQKIERGPTPVFFKNVVAPGAPILQFGLSTAAAAATAATATAATASDAACSKCHKAGILSKCTGCKLFFHLECVDKHSAGEQQLFYCQQPACLATHMLKLLEWQPKCPPKGTFKCNACEQDKLNIGLQCTLMRPTGEKAVGKDKFCIHCVHEAIHRRKSPDVIAYPITRQVDDFNRINAIIRPGCQELERIEDFPRAPGCDHPLPPIGDAVKARRGGVSPFIDVPPKRSLEEEGASSQLEQPSAKKQKKSSKRPNSRLQQQQNVLVNPVSQQQQNVLVNNNNDNDDNDGNGSSEVQARHGELVFSSDDEDNGDE